jgi:hypothetical protein
MANAIAPQRNPSQSRRSVDDAEQRAIPNQLEGYWFTSRQEVPTTRPPFDPNGALLLDADGAHAVVLIEFHGIWLPLSEAAELVYTGPRLVAQGHPVFFAVFQRRGSRPTVYRVDDRILLCQRRVAERYGMVVGRRARSEKKTVQVSVTREP